MTTAVVRVVVDQDQLPFDSPPGQGAVRPSVVSQTHHLVRTVLLAQDQEPLRDLYRWKTVVNLPLLVNEGPTTFAGRDGSRRIRLLCTT